MVKNGRANPAAFKQISSGSVLGMCGFSEGQCQPTYADTQMSGE